MHGCSGVYNSVLKSDLNGKQLVNVFGLSGIASIHKVL